MKNETKQWGIELQHGATATAEMSPTGGETCGAEECAKPEIKITLRMLFRKIPNTAEMHEILRKLLIVANGRILMAGTGKMHQDSPRYNQLQSIIALADDIEKSTKTGAGNGRGKNNHIIKQTRGGNHQNRQRHNGGE